jgi:hypothetical protein
MSFAYSILYNTVNGNKRKVVGTFTNGGGDSGGNIVTGLKRVEKMILQLTGTSVGANVPVVSASFPTRTGTIQIVTDAGADGLFEAEGR